MMNTTNDLILRIECPLKSFHCKRRFSSADWTLKDFCSYLEQLLDIAHENLLVLFRSKRIDIDDDRRRLIDIEHLSPNETIVVESRCPADDIDDLNRLKEKYQMSDDVYSRRKGTLKEFLRANQLGRYDERSRALSKTTHQQRKALRESNRLKLKKIDIGMRVEVNEPTFKSRAGEVIYIGIVRGIHGEFVGVQFDEPCGDSNGCDGTTQYFQAKAKHASFVRPEYIEIVSNAE